MSIRKLTGGLIVAIAIALLFALLFLATVADIGLKAALTAWGSGVAFVAAIVVGFLLLEL